MSSDLVGSTALIMRIIQICIGLPDEGGVQTHHVQEEKTIVKYVRVLSSHSSFRKR